MTGRLVQVVLALAACLVPSRWISLPAAALLVLWFPGRSVVSILPGLESLRHSRWMAVAASMVSMPVPLSWLWQATNSRWAVLAAVGLINVVLVLVAAKAGMPVPRPPGISGRHRLLLAGIVGWTAACVFLSFWLPRLLGNVTVTRAHDFIKHQAVMLSLERHPLPLHNSFYEAEADTPYYYYEYYYLLPAAMRTMTGNRASIPLVFGLTSAILAAAFIELTFLLARDILGSEKGAVLSAACVSLVGGFDILPVLTRIADGGSMVVTLDAWCPVAWRVHNFMTQYFWCPQHVFAVLGLTLAATWLRQTSGRGWWVVVAPLLAASILGGSVHLALIIFPAAALYAIGMMFRCAVSDRARLGRLLGGLCVVCVLGFLLMAGQAWGYRVMNERYVGGLTATWERFPFAVIGRLFSPGPVANWADAPWLLLVELGLPAVACLLVAGRFWDARWSDPGTRLMILAALVGAVLMFTFRSDVNSIDYGFRIAPMVAAPLLAVVAGALLSPEMTRPIVRSRGKAVAILGVVIGLPVGLYEAPMTAVRSVWESRRLRDEAEAMHYLRTAVPADAVVQGDPQRRLDLAALTEHQIGVLDPDSPHVVVFTPRDPARMRRAYIEVLEAFSTSSAATAYSNLDTWGVDYVLVGSVEKTHLGAGPQFEDGSRFEKMYNDGAAAVYRLVRTGSRGRPSVETRESKP